MNQIHPNERLSCRALEWAPIPLSDDGKWVVDIFKHSLSAKDGLPPYAQARIIDLITLRLLKERPNACLWISIDAPGNWYFNEIRRLIKHRLPISIRPANLTSITEVHFYPRPDPTFVGNGEIPHLGPIFDISKYGIKPPALRVLRILARLKTAHTPEITSLVGLSKTYVRTLLKQLQAKKLIEWKRIGKYDGWEIRNKGLRLAHRSWNIPKGVHFAKHRGEYRYAGERHRRVSRMWRGWLETAYEEVEIWECWTEVPLQKGIPDALAWGTHRGYERLFWLEVDSGKSSRKTMEKIYERRLRLAHQHAFSWGIPVVFCILGPKWVVKNFKRLIPAKFPTIAIMGHDWRYFGVLPLYEIGAWHDDLMWSAIYRFSWSGRKLPFDPKQYPPRPKKKISKPLQPKSTKPRFNIPLSDDDTDWVPGRSEIEE